MGANGIQEHGGTEENGKRKGSNTCLSYTSEPEERPLTIGVTWKIEAKSYFGAHSSDSSWGFPYEDASWAFDNFARYKMALGWPLYPLDSGMGMTRSALWYELPPSIQSIRWGYSSGRRKSPNWNISHLVPDSLIPSGPAISEAAPGKQTLCSKPVS